MPVIMGTAGHIDHGKTTLVKALTGIDCDRLVEEKKRGITIELGFAFLDLPGERRVSIVDVPGHERFVKTMVSGATGIDFVMLVIAADEGIMPQTREHLDICALLGIDTGVVALTKTDMVEPEWLDMVTEDVKAFLEPTFLGGAPVIPVSAHTGAGLDTLRGELAALVDRFQPKRRSDLFRLPIDRIFTMRGHGTVVTGTLVSGSLKVGEDVIVYPKGLTTKVRGLQSHGETVEEAPSGRRTAVNLQGLEVEDLERGWVLGRPGTLFPSQVWEAEVSCLASSPLPLKHRKEIHFHHGSREVLAILHLLDRDKIMPGETCVCQVRFKEPLVGVYGDRLVLRSFSPLRTVAGGRLLGPLGLKVKRFSPQVALLDSLRQGAPEDLALTQLLMAGPQGLSFAELLIMTNQESRGLEKTLADLAVKQKVVLYDKEARRYAHGEVFGTLAASLVDFLKDFHAKEPLKQGVSRVEIISRLGGQAPAKLFHLAVEKCLKKGEVVADQDLLRLPDHKVSLASDQASLKDSILSAYAAGGATPPNLKDVLEPLNVTPKEAASMLKVLMEQGALVRVKEDMYYHGPAFEAIKAQVVDYLTANADMGPNELRDFTGLTRKYAIPVLEFLDKEKVTVRVGDRRVLRKK